MSAHQNEKTARLISKRSANMMRPVMQVLDDSTCKATRALVEDKVAEWRERGVNVQCICRDNRQGYKAGALKEVRHRQHRCKELLSIIRDSRQGTSAR